MVYYSWYDAGIINYKYMLDSRVYGMTPINHTNCINKLKKEIYQ